MDYTLEVITQPTIPDTWLGKAKRQLQIEADESVDDMMLADLLEDAAEFVGDRSDIALLPMGFRLTVPRFPCSSLTPIYLPRPPLVTVDQITYLDTTGARQTLDPADYEISTGQVSMVHAATDQYWPSVKCREDSVQIDYTAGASTPRIATRAILLLVGHWFLNREASTEKRLADIPMGVDALISQLQPGDDFRRPIQEDLHSDHYHA